MSNSPLESTVFLQYILDESSLSRVIESTHVVEDSLQGLVESNQAVGESASQLQAIGSFSDQATVSIEKMGEAVVGATDDLKAFYNQYSDLLEQQQGGDGEDGGGGIGISGIRSIGRAANLVGAHQIGRPIQEIAAFGRVAGELDGLKESIMGLGESVTRGIPLIEGMIGPLDATGASIAGLTVIAGAAIPIIGAGIAVYAILNSTLEQSRKTAQEATAYTATYYETISKGTTDSINAELKALEIKKQIDQEQIDDLSQKVRSQSVTDLNSTLGLVALAADQASGGIKTMNDDINTLKADEDKLTGQTKAYSDALKSTSVATNDATAAEVARLKVFDQGVNDETELNRLRREGSVQEIQSRVASNKDRIEAIETEKTEIQFHAQLTGATAETTKKLSELGAEEAVLKGKNDELTYSILPARQAVEDLSKGMKGLTDTITEINSTTTKLLDNQNKFNAETAKIDEDRRVRDTNQEEDFQTQRTYKVADFHTKQASQDADFYQGQATKLSQLYSGVNDKLSQTEQQAGKEAAQYAQQQTDNAKKLGDDINKILNSSRESELDAASRLDARAIAQQERQKQTTITNDVDTYNSQKAISDRNEQGKIDDLITTAQKQHDVTLAQGLEQLKDQDSQYKIKKDREEKAFQLEISRADLAEQTKENRQREADKRQDTERQTAYDNQKTALQDHFKALIGIQDGKQEEIKTSFSGFMSGLVTNAQNAVNSIVGNAQPYYGNVPTVSTGYNANYNYNNQISHLGSRLQEFADGGKFGANQVISVGEKGPELLLTDRPGSILDHDTTNRVLNNKGGNITLQGDINIDGSKLSNMSKQMLKATLIEIIHEEAG